MVGAHRVLNGTVFRLTLPHHSQMRMNDLTAKQLVSVPCPRCGVATGEQCLLHSGFPRSDPHVDRKLSAAEMIETKRISRGHRTSINPLATNKPRHTLVSLLTNSDLEVCCYLISAKVYCY